MSLHLNIEIESTDRGLAMEMLGTNELSAGDTQISLGDGSTVTWLGAQSTKSAGAPQVFWLAISTVGLNLVSNWFYDRLKGRSAKLRINRTEVEIEPDKIRVVIEQIEKGEQ